MPPSWRAARRPLTDPASCSRHLRAGTLFQIRSWARCLVVACWSLEGEPWVPQTQQQRERCLRPSMTRPCTLRLHRPMPEDWVSPEVGVHDSLTSSDVGRKDGTRTGVYRRPPMGTSGKPPTTPTSGSFPGPGPACRPGNWHVSDGAGAPASAANTQGLDRGCGRKEHVCLTWTPGILIARHPGRSVSPLRNGRAVFWPRRPEAKPNQEPFAHHPPGHLTSL